MTNLSIFLFGLPGGMEWVLIALVVLLLFGAKRIPELMRGLGRGIREFKDATKEIKDGIAHEGREIERSVKEEPKREQPRQEAPRSQEREESDRQQPRTEG